MQPSQSVLTAYHEAGHAVVALAHDVPVHRVSILPRQGRLGQCEFGKGSVSTSEDALEREILIALGGLAAEARFAGTYQMGGAERDLRYVRRLVVQRKSERTAKRYEERMLAKVEALLMDEAIWQAIKTIAEELLKHGTISGRAARHLYDEATKDE